MPYGSIKLHPGQTTVIYPPVPGEGMCAEPCTCIFCNQARRDAELLCPHCHQPLGFGNIAPLQVMSLGHRNVKNPDTGELIQEMIWSEPVHIVMIHLNCHEAALLPAKEE